MWRHVATNAEINECERLLRERTVDNPFAVDDTKIPQNPKAAGDPAPPAVPAVLAAPAAPAAPAPGTGGAEPTRSRAFPHMASQKDITFNLPFYDSNAEEGNKSPMKRNLFAAGLLHPDTEPEAKRWHGTHVLGEGASGIVTHWVTVDENNNIDQVS
jgi:hypothetical protein